MKQIVEIIAKQALLLITGILAGTLAMIIVYALPVGRMDTNVRSSMEVFYTEGVYPQQVPGYKSTQLDNETDAIMLLGAIYDGGGYPAWQQAMRAARIDFADQDACCNELIWYAWENRIPDGETEYSRYWHGYMLWLKPLLLVFDYADIRILNMMFQTVLLFLLIKKLTEKGKTRYLLPLAMALIVLNPVAAAMSLQFSSIYDIVLISMLLILRNHEKWRAGNRYLYLFFGLGMITAFFDFLTYPMAALCMPLTLYLILEQKNWKAGVWKVILFSLCFGAGYAGMWAGKWLMGSLLLQENVLEMVLTQFAVHTGNATINGAKLSKLDVILRNLKVLMKWPYLLCFASGMIVCVKGISLKMVKEHLSMTAPFLIVGVIPFVWIYLTSSHAAWCYWYTYRGFMASAFAFFCALALLPRKARLCKKPG
ncbi:MAG: hypothetical protein Q4C58_13135 [Eubacteriales bacterium]|nr:hypothetical protein [Eubacteriales bacterium]